MSKDKKNNKAVEKRDLSLEELQGITGGFSSIGGNFGGNIALPMYGLQPPDMPIMKYGIKPPDLPIMKYGIRPPIRLYYGIQAPKFV